ncbi:RluA family pseudouridine synthase [Acholeplasma granularum]|uniref:RluA family pseudouridine synthase n=1 Tax=Acholeplasma granularum TaxID=264635 RepID=UPI0004716FD6|nr:RluA family pseudouridine synthase [Acholeplasma granularum]
MKKINFQDNESIRLDHYLVNILEISRNQITTLIKEGQILVNNLKVKPGFLLQLNDEITINIPEKEDTNIKPVAMDLDIIYEDNDILIINKPKGLVVHPSETFTSPTLVHGLIHHTENLSDVNDETRPGIVHRIDKDTSGLLMIAKTNEAHKILAQDLKKHAIKRSYYALVHGVVTNSSAIINAPIGRHPKVRTKNAVIASGKHSVTHFKTVRIYQKYSLLDCDLETGRTHQIRVHLAYIGHPVVGDPLYSSVGEKVESGQLLHAYKLEFTHPITKKAMTFEAPLPEVFETYLSRLS